MYVCVYVVYTLYIYYYRFSIIIYLLCFRLHKKKGIIQFDIKFFHINRGEARKSCTRELKIKYGWFTANAVRVLRKKTVVGSFLSNVGIQIYCQFFFFRYCFVIIVITNSLQFGSLLFFSKSFSSTNGCAQFHTLFNYRKSYPQLDIRTTISIEMLVIFFFFTIVHLKQLYSQFYEE